VKLEDSPPLYVGGYEFQEAKCFDNMSPAATIILPGQFTRRAELYHQLAQLTAAGLPILQALEQLERHPPSRAFREPLNLMVREIAAGFTFSEAIARSGKWVSAFDLALIDAGERSGRLDGCFRLLADHYTERARMIRRLLGDLAYPVFLLHFAVFILPFAQLFTTGDWFTYLTRTLGVLLPIYVIVGVLIYAAQGKHGEGWRSVVERLLHYVPVVGSGRRELALARLAMALEALISAGVTIIEAWELAATVSGSPALRRTVQAWLPDVRAGQTPAEAVTACGKFPDLFTNQYNSGEVSGKLEDTLRRMHQYYQEEGARKIQAVSQWTPRFVYLFIALAIAYNVVKFWMKYFEQIGQAGGF
jgi:type IV pilus assembly protein PilC